tara:strand:- start:49377 stop:50102 length:726 start_codon:yes stop_codon:yes gene_type:complete
MQEAVKINPSFSFVARIRPLWLYIFVLCSEIVNGVGARNKYIDWPPKLLKSRSLMIKFSLTYDLIRKTKMVDLARILREAKKARLKDIKIYDILTEIQHGNGNGQGLYLLFGPKGELYYVGKCVGSSFIEKLPEQFRYQESGRQATLLYSIQKKDGFGKPKDRDEYIKGALRVMENFDVMLIHFAPEDSTEIAPVESLMRRTLQPLLNEIYGRTDVRGSTVQEWVKAFRVRAAKLSANTRR